MRYASSIGNMRSVEKDRGFAGLCADCQFAKRINSARGTVFYLCKMSATDESFAKYPRLPMIECVGYVARPLEDSAPSMEK